MKKEQPTLIKPLDTNVLKAKTKIYQQNIGAKVRLCQSRFSEEQIDTVFTIDSVSSFDFRVKETDIMYNFSKNDTLILKDLKKITDEQLIQVANFEITRTGVEFDYNIHTSILGFKVIKVFQKGTNGYRSWYGSFPITDNLKLKSYQYLNSLGYALPYMEYSVADLVELGIYELEK